MSGAGVSNFGVSRLSSGREQAIAIWRGGVRAVLGDQAIREHVQIEDDCLVVDTFVFPLDGVRRCLIVGAGKATAAMAAGLLSVIADRLPCVGAINVPQGAAAGFDLAAIEVCEARPQGINEPTEMAIRGTRRIIDLVSQATADDLCITLLSGGASALLVAPAGDVTLNDKLAVTRLLSASGATIHELNTVRKSLSRVKGGGLAASSRAGQNLTLVLSDVIGDRLDIIGSGPTVVSQSTPLDALAVLERYDPHRTLPPAIYRHLTVTDPQPAAAADCPAVIVANNAAAVDAAGVVAERLGYSHAMNSATSPEGTAEEVGQRLAAIAVEMLHHGPPQPDCLITGGEPTVVLPPADRCGKGGRNQQVVLAAMVALQQCQQFHAAHRSRLTILSAGSDGEDGPTDAAGAVLDEHVWQEAERLQLSAADFLERKDAYRFFQATGGLLQTGPTGTNVCDLRVVLVDQA